MPETCDVFILGGAYSGAVSGILLKRAKPHLKVVIAERTECFDRKVGESTSEVAGCFLSKVIKIHDYLSRNHITKHGLRMWFHKTGEECFTRCSEIGSYFQVRLPTFQLDRSELDQHLLELAEKEGCEILRPASVKTVETDGKGRNFLQVATGDTMREFQAEWVVDASGKAAVLARKMKILEPMPGHPTNSIWARFTNVLTLDDHEVLKDHPEFGLSCLCARSTATNHLCGRGWWSWIIPLRNGQVSFGLTWDPRLFTPESAGTIPERLLAHAKTTPIGRLLFSKAEAVPQDAKAYSQLPYRSKQVMGDGWAIVGDAAGFMDPLYSQGLDYCSHTAYAVHKIILESFDGKDITERTKAYNAEFQSSYQRWFEALYQGKYHYLGDAELMNIAFHMDLATYFIGPVRLVYKQPDIEFSILPYNGPIGGLFAKFMRLYNRRLAHIADKRVAAGRDNPRNLDQRYLIKSGFAPNRIAVKLLFKGMRLWLKAELGALFLPRLKKQAAAPEQLTTADMPSK